MGFDGATAFWVLLFVFCVWWAVVAYQHRGKQSGSDLAAHLREYREHISRNKK